MSNVNKEQTQQRNPIGNDEKCNQNVSFSLLTSVSSMKELYSMWEQLSVKSRGCFYSTNPTISTESN